MKQITKVIDTFDAPIAKVWAVISAYGMEKVWIEGVLSTSLEGVGIGALRTLEFKDFVAVEILEECDPNAHRVGYRLLDPAPVPATGGRGVMELTKTGSDQTQIEWTCTVETVTDGWKAWATEVDTMYKASVSNIKRFLGSENVDSPRSIVQRWWAAMERGDMATVADYLTDDMVWEVMGIGYLMPYGGVFRGKEVIVRELLPFVENAYDMSTMKMTITDSYNDGPVVIIEFTVNAVTSRGQPYVDAKYISVITVVDGKIKSAREYPDALKAKAAHLD